MAKSPRVADFSTHLSGPVASRRLAQMGADVIKVEHPTLGDGNRSFPPMFHEDGIHHLYLNAGTRSLALDWRSPSWPRTVAAIARWADVVIVGNRPAQAQRMGIDAASLLAHKPELVYCMITGYGLAGEWAALPAHGLNMDALAGAIPLEWQDGQPEVPEHYRSVGTTVAGIEAVAGIYAALHRCSRGEGGQIVHVSIWEAALAWQWRDLATFANLERPWTAYRDLGSRYAVYGTQDAKALLVCPIERRFWDSFCTVLELPDDVRARGDWSSGSDMGSDYIALGERTLIGERLRLKPRDEWVALLREAQVPVAPVLDWRESMASAHAQANGTMASYDYRERAVRVPVAPVSVTAASAAGSTEAIAEAHRRRAEQVPRAPYLGEHNDEILKELGLADGASHAH
ncbi:Formyl-coenzyme A transferase [Variovorax sp. SRS16]|uniref:CaiB/BaiF CoA transferase family protein n=1 Tax=Variovorax sp. SRS16 TaxID=282217 RepID=UPI00131605C7|nr:CaiB/BaiF CoA-transferase family protein [Variovorax sp. SRS16]VTU29547.1 Formyl-coenzyme A transferase [Variovorax sp. SRS16]